MKEYLGIAIPSFFFVIIEWSAHNVLTFFAGIIGAKAAGSQVILVMLWLQFISGSMGMATALSTVVG